MTWPTHIRRRAEVTAWQFPGGAPSAIPWWLADRVTYASATCLIVDTLYAAGQGAAPGDWIVMHEAGGSAGLVVLSHREFTILYEHIEGRDVSTQG